MLYDSVHQYKDDECL